MNLLLSTIVDKRLPWKNLVLIITYINYYKLELELSHSIAENYPTFGIENNIFGIISHNNIYLYTNYALYTYIWSQFMFILYYFKHL